MTVHPVSMSRLQTIGVVPPQGGQQRARPPSRSSRWLAGLLGAACCLFIAHARLCLDAAPETHCTAESDHGQISYWLPDCCALPNQNSCCWKPSATARSISLSMQILQLQNCNADHSGWKNVEVQAVEKHGPGLTYGLLLAEMDNVLRNVGGGSSVGAQPVCTRNGPGLITVRSQHRGERGGGWRLHVKQARHTSGGCVVLEW